MGPIENPENHQAAHPIDAYMENRDELTSLMTQLSGVLL